jgi:hypothetical protein
MCVCIIEFVVVLLTVSKEARTTHHRQRITGQHFK